MKTAEDMIALMTRALKLWSDGVTEMEPGGVTERRAIRIVLRAVAVAETLQMDAQQTRVWQGIVGGVMGYPVVEQWIR